MKETSAYIRAHRQAIEMQNGTLMQENTKCATHYQINYLKDEQGHGFSDLYDFGRVIVGRSNIELNQPYTLTSDLPLRFFGVNILLTGAHEIEFSDLQQTFSLKPPSIGLRKGYLGKVVARLPAHTLALITFRVFLRPILATHLSLT